MAVRHEESDATRRYSPLLSFAREHVTLLATMVAALIFALRCVAVSGGDVYVASILVAETSTWDAIRALLFTVLPILLYVVSIAAAVMASGRIINYGLRDPATLGLLIASAVAWLARRYSSDGSLEVLNYVAALAIPFSVWMYRLVMMEPGRFRRVAVMVIAVTFISLVSWDFVSALGEGAFWLPRERLVFQNEAPPDWLCTEGKRRSPNNLE